MSATTLVRKSNVLGWDGTPVMVPAGNPRSRADGGIGAPPGLPLYGWNIPYQAADPHSQEMAQWYPQIHSPDATNEPWRRRISARVHDIARNDGWVSGGITRIVDSTVGADLMLQSMPDYVALGLDAVWADEFSAVVEAKWRLWAEDYTGKFCDAARRQTFGQMSAVAFRHKLLDGDAIGVLHWMDERVGPGMAHYATALEVIHPDRLSNEYEMRDTMHHRGGVEIDDHGAAVAYWFRHGFPGDWFDPDQLKWTRIPRETPWGRAIVVHDFDITVAGQNRAGIGILAPVLGKLKMLNKYDQVELQAAVLNAVFAAVIESPFDHSLIGDALQSDDASPFEQRRGEFHQKFPLDLNGVRIPITFPGEKMNWADTARPNKAFEAFEAACLRNIASAMGTSYEQLSQDYTKTNYSSARAALLESWKTLTKRRNDFAQGFCTPIYAAWLEEEIDNGEIPMPRKAPDFVSMRAAYAHCEWIGPARGWVDPVKEPQGSILLMSAQMSSLRDECATQGKDWRRVLAQIAIEDAARKRLGVPVPNSDLQPINYDENPAIEEGGKPK